MKYLIEKEQKPVYRMNGVDYGSLEDAKRAALTAALELPVNPCPEDMILDVLLSRAEEVVDILTTREGSLPKARKIHGGRKVRKSKGGAAGVSVFAPVELSPRQVAQVDALAS